MQHLLDQSRCCYLSSPPSCSPERVRPATSDLTGRTGSPIGRDRYCTDAIQDSDATSIIDRPPTPLFGIRSQASSGIGKAAFTYVNGNRKLISCRQVKFDQFRVHSESAVSAGTR